MLLIPAGLEPASARRIPWVTLALVVLCAAVFALTGYGTWNTPFKAAQRNEAALRYFMEHRGATISREELLTEVWGYQAMPSTRTVDVHVAWLRQKLEPNSRVPQYILTVHGLGYKFVG